MAARSFRDAFGLDWIVWAVQPQLGERRSGTERRSGRDRRADPTRRRATAAADRRRLAERRVVHRPRVFIPGFEQGWLCFEAAGQRRRLAPIPSGWEQCDEQALEGYCRRAVPATPASRST